MSTDLNRERLLADPFRAKSGIHHGQRVETPARPREINRASLRR